MHARTILFAIMLVGGLPILLPAQILVPEQSAIEEILPNPRRRPPIRPYPRPVPRPVPRPIHVSYRVRSVDVQVDVHDQAAKVRMSQLFENTGSATLETEFLFPLPEDAAVSDLTLLCDGKELTGKLLNKDDARRIYEEIVRRQRDPALLEFVGRGLFRTSVFPIPPHSERTVEIRYSQLLRKTGGLTDLLLPLGTFKQANHAIETLNVRFRFETTEAIKTVYSPTHSVDITRPDEHHASGKLTLDRVTAPNDLRILLGTHAGPVGMSVVSYRPSEKEDGYFMLLASPELKAAATATVPKTVLIVVDRSGSMSGPKIEQVRQAVKFLLQQLKPSDTFNIVAYDSEVEAFRPELQRVTSDTIHAATSFAEGLNAGGGTNIDGALKTALGLLVDPQRPSYVLFLTDGVPTVGEQNEMKIVAAAREADKVHARIFNLGVGFDVNGRLLDRLSRELNGQTVYVRPTENIETYVSTLAKTIGSALLTDVDVKFEFDSPASGGEAPAISRTYPRRLTDLFAGEQLVWVGRYHKAGPVKVVLSGNLGGQRQSFTISGKLAEKSVGDTDAFVEKVWATRRIGEIIDEIDLHGQNRELIDELVQLSMKHGILTPYTSFLADEHTNLNDTDGLHDQAGGRLRGLSNTSGAQAFGQRALKAQYQSSSGQAFPLNLPAASSDKYGVSQGVAASPSRGFHRGRPVPGGMGGMGGGMGGGFGGGMIAPRENEAKESKTKRSVLTVGQKAFYWKNDRWRDADVTAEGEKNPVRIKQFSAEYFDLAAKNSGQFAKYLAMEGPVLIALDGKTYLIEPDKAEARSGE